MNCCTQGSHKKPSILVVDDKENNFYVIETFLHDLDGQLHYVASGFEAIAALESLEPDLILLDVMMPEMDGIEVCRRIKAMPKWKSVPIVMVTALTDKKDLAKCMEAGADDFISKPVNRLELGARARSMLRIHQQYEQLESFNTDLEAIVRQRTAELHLMVYQDSLTQLPSRAHLIQSLSDLSATDLQQLCLVLLDCDRFQLINGSYGHEVGNQVLVAIANRLSDSLLPGDELVRMGADEFCFLLKGKSTEEVNQFIQEIYQHFEHPLPIEGREIFITFSTGVAFNSSLKLDPEALVQNADTAMYQAKLNRAGTYQIFDDCMRLNILKQLTLENDLQRAIEQQEFRLHYQPIVRLDQQTVAGCEALIRWKHPERGLVYPGEFIDCLETTGLIIPAGIEVLRQACQQLRLWRDRGWTELFMSVNLSTKQFSSATLIEDIDRVIEETGVDSQFLKLEITESAIMDDPDKAVSITQALRERHIQIGIDDFGTGYSSLSYLHEFSVDNLKIDRSFIHRIFKEPQKESIVETIILLGKQLGLSLIAEGIETTQQLEYLKKLACEYGQGFLFSKPLPSSEFERMLLNAAMIEQEHKSLPCLSG